ncbi:MAG: type II secretion system protein [Candidatus Nealsonbacteria bacterium]|nr:type II secretion system protein [Candidatus Nealsonbacteria bacterium]
MKNAFTVIEILVVLGIVVFLTAAILPSYRLGGQVIALERSANFLSQEIRRVQEMAVSSKEVGRGIVPQGQEFYPAGGFGIYLKRQPFEITIFADCNGNGEVDRGIDCGTSPNKFSEVLESLSLEQGTNILSLSPSSPLTIIFKAPDPLTIISGGNEATLTLSLNSDASKTKVIKVNSAGLIYVE